MPNASMTESQDSIQDTQRADYAHHLARLDRWWKRLFDVQRPYRRHLRQLRLGFVLDVGCGLGRNLVNLGGRDAGVGVDHNVEAVEISNRRGLVAFTPEAFRTSPYATPGRFDAFLLAHVVEHMQFEEARRLLADYRPFLRVGGRVVFITPQEAGFRSDPTHVDFMDLGALDRLARAAGLDPIAAYSFPFPRAMGKAFKYNEFVLVARKLS